MANRFNKFFFIIFILSFFLIAFSTALTTEEMFFICEEYDIASFNCMYMWADIQAVYDCDNVTDSTCSNSTIIYNSDSNCSDCSQSLEFQDLKCSLEKQILKLEYAQDYSEDCEDLTCDSCSVEDFTDRWVRTFISEPFPKSFCPDTKCNTTECDYINGCKSQLSYIQSEQSYLLEMEKIKSGCDECPVCVQTGISSSECDLKVSKELQNYRQQTPIKEETPTIYYFGLLIMVAVGGFFVYSKMKPNLSSQQSFADIERSLQPQHIPSKEEIKRDIIKKHNVSEGVKDGSSFE